LQEATKANPYEYTGDNPVNAVDPSGTLSLDCLGSISYNLVLAGIGGYLSYIIVIPDLTGLITGASATTAIGAILAAGGALLGVSALLH
jgi:hypothetical protein